MSDQEKNQLNIELDEQTAQGVYSNLVLINHSQTEFVIDFISVMPGMPKPKVKSRIVLAPQHAKRFLQALQENVQKFEEQNGQVSEEMTPFSFGPAGQA